MTVFQGVFLGFLLGSIATMFCIWLAGGELTGGYEEAPDDAATSEPGQTQSDTGIIPQKDRKVK